jgi:small subunit ribosomal protein S2
MFGIEELFERGFHYGHRKWRSSPKMKQFVFCEKWGIYIIDLCQTVPMFIRALETLKACSAKGGKVLFVGTKHQASELLKEAALSCNQFYVNKRWLGGTITNNATIGMSINKLAKLEKDEAAGLVENLTKKEKALFAQAKEKKLALLSGIRNLHGAPDILVVVDPRKEETAIKEAAILNIPVIALTDTDARSPEMISHCVPGNDESKAAISFFLEKCVEAIKEGQESHHKNQQEVRQ